MVKLTDIPTTKDKEPSKSVIVLEEDKVIIYLFADGFMGTNYQVGYMDIQNIFIKDNRENPYMNMLKQLLFSYGNNFMELMKKKSDNLEIDPETYDIASYIIYEYNEFVATQLGVK